MKTKAKELNPGFYRLAYGAFILLSLYFLFFNHDISMAVANFGIALVFDPFNQQVKRNDRPVWQRVWLIVHLLILLTGFVWMLVA